MFRNALEMNRIVKREYKYFEGTNCLGAKLIKKKKKKKKENSDLITEIVKTNDLTRSRRRRGKCFDSIKNKQITTTYKIMNDTVFTLPPLKFKPTLTHIYIHCCQSVRKSRKEENKQIYSRFLFPKSNLAIFVYWVFLR